MTRGDQLPSRDWLAALFGEDEISTAARRALLSGVPPVGVAQQGPMVCACFGVGKKRLVAAIRGGQLTTVEAIGDTLQAGTNCGSCIPELKSLLSRVRHEDAA